MSNCNEARQTPGKIYLDKDSTEGQWAIWLDHRNQARTAYLAGLISGTLPAERFGIRLARNFQELRELGKKTPGSSGILQTSEQMVKLMQSRELASTPLSRLCVDEQQKYVSNLQWADYYDDGVRYQYLSAMYFGDLLQKHSFSYSDLFEVMSIFGIGPEYAVLAYHKFGCEADPNYNCQPRMYWSCPASSNC